MYMYIHVVYRFPESPWNSLLNEGVYTTGVMAAVYIHANAPLIDGLDMRMRIFRSDKNGRLRISRTTEGVLDLCNGAVSEKTPHIF